MARSPHRRLAPRPLVAAVLLAALTAACSSTVAGSAVSGPAAPGSAAPHSAAPSASTGTASPPSSSAGAPSSGITVPSSGGVTTGQPDGADGTIGDPGIGDPYYPLEGNGGYQIDSYDVSLSYDPPTNALQSTATLKGTVLSEEGLTQFDLDLQPTMLVSEVTVNGAPATFTQNNAELVITTAALLAPQSALEVVVTYSGKPDLVPGGTSGISDGGWYRTDSGGAIAIGEPSNASAWYPVNEHPADTATFAVTATVPDKWKVISNGVQQTDGLPDPGPGKSVYRWQLSEPVASYLTTIYIDDFTLVQDTMADGKPIVSAIAPDAGSDAPRLAGDTKQILDVLSGYFGPYPFEAAGGIFTGLSNGFALETATRPVYGGGQIASLETVVHELAHQWYGDDVAIKRWSDICLNECFASYAPWLYDAQVNKADLDARWKQQMSAVLNQPRFWASPLVDMGPGNEFTRVYDRGPLALHALRAEIGDEAFLTLLKQWPAMYGGKNASFDDLETYVTTLAGRDMGPFMDAWFRGTTVPAQEFRYPGNLGG
jgi:aminopeptidase N